MFVKLLKTARNAVMAIAATFWVLGWGNTSAYAQCCMDGHAGHAGHDAGSAGHQHGATQVEHTGHTQSAPQPQHGGQLTVMNPLAFEIVYLPQEIRVYLYGPAEQPETAKDVNGEIAMLARGNDRVSRVPLHYVVPPPGSQQQDYLAAAVNLSRVKDGDVTATIRLANLPLPHRPEATFAQAVVLSKARPQVTLAPLGPGDQAGIARQQVCPVTGARLGSMGDPIKVLIGGQPLFLCCKGCFGKVQANPAAYLHKAGLASQGQ